ncbi:ABC transporter ATP-binding protein [Anaerosporobacter sp.]
MAWLISYSKPYIPKIALLLSLDLVATLVTVVLAVVTKDIIDSATNGGAIVQSLVIYIVMLFGSQLITVISSMISVVINEKFSFGIRKQVYEKIMNSHWMDVKKYHTGDLVTRLSSDAGNVADGIVTVIPTIFRLIIELVATFFTLFYYEPRLAIFALSIAPIVAVVCFLLGRKLKVLQVKVQETESAYRSFMQESLSNLLVVKAFANEQYSTDKLVELRDERFYWVLKKSKMGIISSTIMSISFQLGYIAAFAFGAIQLSRKVITYGTMSVFLTLVNRIQAPVMSLAQYVPKVVNILASAGRIIEIQDIPMEEKLENHIEAENIGININNLTFGYTEEEVLEGANIQIRPGEFVAIVGESGIGKTTLVRLIMSFMSEVGGCIEFNNSLGQVEKANAGTRNFISYVPQGNTLFSGTIRENVRMGRLDCTEEEIVEALTMASGYEFVSELPNGLDTVIGESGHGISEGQAQRIAIARALVRKAPFLILDEATSSLDEKTELSVLQGIQNISPRPTCLLITHRRSVLKYCDREICIYEKKIFEQLI